MWVYRIRGYGGGEVMEEGRRGQKRPRVLFLGLRSTNVGHVGLSRPCTWPGNCLEYCQFEVEFHRLLLLFSSCLYGAVRVFTWEVPQKNAFKSAGLKRPFRRSIVSRHCRWESVYWTGSAYSDVEKRLPGPESWWMLESGVWAGVSDFFVCQK